MHRGEPKVRPTIGKQYVPQSVVLNGIGFLVQMQEAAFF